MILSKVFSSFVAPGHMVAILLHDFGCDLEDRHVRGEVVLENVTF